jgi:hypothetical protein
MGFFIVLVVCAGVIGVMINMAKQNAWRQAKESYEEALGALSRNPNSNEHRIAALTAGRTYAELARKAAGSNGVALFDEVALQNDLNARQGSGVPQVAAPALPAGGTTAASSSDRLDQLTKLAELRDKGALTPEEFEAEKRRILSS